MESNPLDLELEELAGQLDWLQALAVAMVADFQAAEDLVQRALQEATAKGGWQPGKLKPWLVGTMRNLAKQHFRTESRRRRREEKVAEQARIQAHSLAEAADHPSPEQLASQVESQHLLSQAVLDIEEPFRSTILLFYFGGWSQRRIAEHQGVSLRTVETRLRRARRRLRDTLQGKFGKDSWAMCLVPLLLRNPPPVCPPPIVAAGPGSVGGGWWASTAILLGLGVWALGLMDTKGTAARPGLQANAHTSMEPSAADLQEALHRQDLPATDQEHRQEALAMNGARSQQLRVVERGSGEPVAGQRMRVMFVRNPTAQERLQVENPMHFRPRDRVWWQVGKRQGVTDERGDWSVAIPEEATYLFLDLGVHNETHSMALYGKGSITYPLSKSAPDPIHLEMVLRTGTASGFVLDEDGNPLGDALVDVYYDSFGRDAANPTLTVTSSADGRFTIPSIACDQGSLRLRARKAGFLCVRELRMERYAGFGVDYPGISLSLSRISGNTEIRVTDTQGNPLPGVAVQGTLADRRAVVGKYAFGSYFQEWSFDGSTDPDGQVHPVGVPDVPVRWRVTHPDMLDWERTVEKAPQRIPVTLEKGGRLKVLVTGQGQPVPRATVGIYGPKIRRVVVADEAGAVSVSGIPPGEPIHVTVSHPDFALWVSPPTPVRDREHSLPVALKPGLSLSGLVLKEGDAGTRSDQVFLRDVYAQGFPRIRAPERGKMEESWLQVVGLDVVTSAADGSFTFPGLPEMDAELWYGMRLRPLGFARAHSGAEDVVLSPGSSMEGLAQVDVRVFERHSGLPVTTYYLHWRREDPGMGQDIPGVTVNDAEGVHRQSGLDPGQWTLVVWAPQGYTTREIGPVDLQAGPQVWEVALDFARNLRLRVVDEQGVGLEGVTVEVMDNAGNQLLQTGFDGNGFEDRLVTDERGQLTLSSVPAEQSYRIECRWGGLSHAVDLPGARVEGEMRTVVMPVHGSH